MNTEQLTETVGTIVKDSYNSEALKQPGINFCYSSNRTHGRSSQRSWRDHRTSKSVVRAELMYLKRPPIRNLINGILLPLLIISSILIIAMPKRMPVLFMIWHKKFPINIAKIILS